VPEPVELRDRGEPEGAVAAPVTGAVGAPVDPIAVE
jgi:hypothetical protein